MLRDAQGLLGILDGVLELADEFILVPVRLAVKDFIDVDALFGFDFVIDIFLEKSVDIVSAQPTISAGSGFNELSPGGD